MLNKLRRNFILISAGSFLIVLILLVAGINLVNYSFITRMQDRKLDSIVQTNVVNAPIVPQAGENGIGVWGTQGAPPELEFTTRFFTVYYDAQENLTDVDLDNIASITEADAAQYGDAVLCQGKSSGYHQSYRYRLVDSPNSITIYFLNVNSELQLVDMILYISIAIALLAFAIVFLLIFFFSKRAISPFVRNMEKQKQFITDANHELKTPLTSISTSADILTMELGDNEWIENIRKQSNRLTKLAEDLTALSRLDEEKPLPEQIDFSISEVAWEAAEPFSSRIKATGKRYEQKIEDNLVLHGDPGAIQQMIALLLDNAIKYSDDDGKIRFKVYKKRQIIIEVFNTSSYIVDKGFDRFFERFYRSDSSRSRETGGAGIGLSIVKAVVDAHKGKIRATSPDGKSLKIEVIL